MRFQYTKSNPPALIEAIEAFEKDLPVALPDDYKEFLLNDNGGTLRYHHLPYNHFNRGESLLTIEQIYGLSWDGDKLAHHPDRYGRFENEQTLATFDVHYMRERADERLPLHMLEIAYAMGGHFSVIMSLLPDNAGSTYVWLDHGMIVEHIAPSFTGFLDKITDDNEP